MTKQLQHSEGPWAFDESESAIVGKHTTIATFLSVDLPTEADGILMAASPTMLRLLRVFAVPITQLRRLSDGELRAALEETAELVSRLDGVE